MVRHLVSAVGDELSDMQTGESRIKQLMQGRQWSHWNGCHYMGHDVRIVAELPSGLIVSI